MGLMKINQILKKYKELHKKHKESWEKASERIRIASDKIKVDDEHIAICGKTYEKESYNYQVEGNKLFDAMMKELDGHEVFPKKFPKLKNES